MAITINLSEPVINLTTAKGTITDNSTYTSPTRSGVGVFVKVYKVDSSSTREALATVGNTADPETDASWEYDFPTDGYTQVFYVAAPDYNGGTSYARYDAVFDPSTNLVYRSKTNGNSGNALNNTTYWELVSEPTALCLNIGTSTESGNLTTDTSIAVLHTVPYPITKTNFGTITGDSFLEVPSSYRRTQDVRLAELLGIAVVAIEIAKDRQEYILAEKFCRKAIDLCDQC